MDLPIDHFRLLGVSPATDLQSVLRVLEQRIDRPPDQGFTLETLQARTELLRSSADLLCDPERRQHYESELTALDDAGESLQAALDVPASKEVAGLLLLLEAGMALDCFELASRALQPPQAPALGSGREADLSLVAGLACLEAARDLRQERRYEAAARVLGQGNQLLQRVGQHGGLRQRMADERRSLRPYRVLDLLSRDLGASEERGEGLTLLEELVQERGGLEGQADPDLGPEEFQAFFRQIRAYLTVQEQIDLFERWAPGSPSADFLAATALTALGFAQRKPERIAAARSRLLVRDNPDIKPLLACLDLLLGRVDSAEFQFADGASEELKEWAARQSDEPLAQVCAYCRDWLARDVLPGYRDLEADPDLEAYFADRDVQAYLDRLESGVEPVAASGSAGSVLGGGVLSPFAMAGGALPGAQALLGLGPLDSEGLEGGEEGESDDELEAEDAEAATAGRRRPALILAAALAALVLALGLGSLLRPRPATLGNEPEAGQKQKEERPPAPDSPASDSPAAKPPAPAAAKPPRQEGEQPAPPAAIPLRSEQPKQAEIRTLLETWLAAKATVLAGGDSPVPLDSLARPAEIAYLRLQQRQSAAKQQTLKVDTSVNSLTIEESSPSRIAALVTLAYRAQPIDAAGQPAGQATQAQLRNRYVFARDGGTWRVVSFERIR